eukprot:1486620-Alexandrium_andersonii.AAC.1
MATATATAAAAAAATTTTEPTRDRPSGRSSDIGPHETWSHHAHLAKRPLCGSESAAASRSGRLRSSRGCG